MAQTRQENHCSWSRWSSEWQLVNKSPSFLVLAVGQPVRPPGLSSVALSSSCPREILSGSAFGANTARDKPQVTLKKC